MRLNRGWAALCAAMLVVPALLAGCGGGGGGGNDEPAGGGNPALPASSGLLPDALALGATLSSDASTLRPLRDGAVMHYRGRRLFANGYESAYENTVQQLADGAGVREAQSNALDDGEDPGVPVIVADGQVTQRQSLPLVEGQPALTVNFIELRSPVRTGDRYVSLDQGISAGTDLDGDGVHDTIAVAVWTDVIGPDTVTLGTGAALQTVHTRTYARLRAQYSSDNTVSETSEIVVDTWYAPGVGVVKTRADADGGLDVVEELLVSRDGIDEGIGASAAIVPLAPDGTALPVPSQAVGFDNHAVALSQMPGEPESTGFALTQLDARGRIVATRNYRYAERLAHGGSGGSPSLLRWGDELRVVVLTDAGLQLLRLDATGQRLLAERASLMPTGPLAIGNDPKGYQVAADGSALWVSGLDEPVYDDVAQTLWSTGWLQAFDGTGQPAGPRLMLATDVDPLSLFLMRLAATEGRVLASWLQIVNSSRQWHYAVADASAPALLATGLLPLAAGGSASACEGELSPWWSGVSGALSCTGGPESPGTTVLDEALAPRLAGGALQRDPLVPAALLPTNQNPPTLFALPTGWGLVDNRDDILWPGDPLPTAFLQFVDLPLAGSAVDLDSVRILARVPDAQIQPVQVLLLGNRLLVVGADCVCQGGRLSTQLVWR